MKKRSIYVLKYRVWKSTEYFPSSPTTVHVIAQTPYRAMEVVMAAVGENIHVEDISFYADVDHEESL